jgi:hypothetical protein
MEAVVKDSNGQPQTTILVPCEACGSGGRMFVGSYEDERDIGECPVCQGTGREEVEGELIEMEDLDRV